MSALIAPFIRRAVSVTWNPDEPLSVYRLQRYRAPSGAEAWGLFRADRQPRQIND